MKSTGIRISQIMKYLTQQAGGYQNVGFIAQDLYNALHACDKAEISNGDFNAIIAYFEVKKESDVGFYMNYSTDDDTRLHNLFWADATSRSDYTCFGDVIAFDTTYKKNAYDRPLMLIVGVNHHHQTIVFGVAVIADETTDTFEWVLRSFLEAMHYKGPNSVVTDWDRAMQRAIRTVIPDARHRLCTWHIARNAQMNISDPLFVQAFCRCMNSWWTPTEFDRKWTAMVKQFNVANHPWVIEKDRTREMWAQACITGYSFGTLRTTQRCESLNAALGIYLKSKKTYIEFVRSIDQEVSRLRTKELEANYFSTQTTPYHLSKLNDIEGHAAFVYTRKSFFIFQEELQQETLYRLHEPVVEKELRRIYILGKYRVPSRRMDVVFDPTTKTIQCSCRRFETIGLPCRHQIHVMKLEDLSRIPQSLIMHRWTKNAKLCAPSYVDDNVDPQMLHMVQYASLSSSCNKIYYVASKITQSFNTSKTEINTLTAEMEKLCELSDPVSDNSRPSKVRDPMTRRTKTKTVAKEHTTSKVKKCGYCRVEGHTKVTCPEL